AHPLGARPFKRPDYVRKFRTLAEGIISEQEQDRFIKTVERLTELSADELAGLNITALPGKCEPGKAHGIFDWQG
ncbi:MmgE/PrpD family protein, partial [Salmonella enterica]|nr:MmgE/PrpD family protein [Salmonella enterica]